MMLILNFIMKEFLNILLKFSRVIHEIWVILFPVSYAKYYYKKNFNKKLNLRNPKDFNEKIQWLKIYSDLSQWTDLADKYKVREYVEKCGLKNILVKLYGVWKNADEIDFNKLPEKFILKTNNYCGNNILVYDKKELDVKNTRILLNKWVNIRYGLVSLEPHYWNIEGRIIAEELLEDPDHKDLTTSLIDYKFFCFHGEPYIINVLYDRSNMIIGTTMNPNSSNTREILYDLEWNIVQNGYSYVDPHCQILCIPKPKCLDEMIFICRKLSRPFPQVRVDLYEVNGKVYFGEFTFTSGSMDVFSSTLIELMGDKIDLSLAKRRTKKFII